MKTFALTPLVIATLLNAAAAKDATSDTVWMPENAIMGAEKAAVELSVKQEDVPTMGRVPTLTLQGDNEDYEFFTIEWGRIQVIPRAKYRAIYYVMAEVEQPTDGLYLMIREHATPEGSPLNREYYKLPVSNRSISQGDIGNWVKKEFVFTTGDEAGFLAAALVIQPFKGRIVISPIQLLPADTDASSSNSKKNSEEVASLDELRETAARRKSLVQPPLIFSRAQVKYGLGLNYYHTWLDRPLMNFRSYRNSDQANFTEMEKEAMRYGLDGLAFFPETKGRMAVFDMAERANIEGFQLLPELIIYNDSMEGAVNAVKRAIQSPKSVRINGKVLMSGYSSEIFTPDQWKNILAELRERAGPFLFVPSLATATQKIRIDYRSGRPITQQAIEKAQAFLRSYLDVCDGIYFNYPPALRNPDGSFDGEFYRNICIPIFQSVLAEPQYKDKLLGLSAYRAHFNPDNGNARGFKEDLTRTLRSTLSIAMEARPDFIILPEWDEFNENTVFMPTIFGGTTTQRIVRYYTSRMRGEALKPAEGDDVSRPNLILSSRKTVVLGETLEYELLHVPDSTDEGTYSVRLSLTDETGALVKQFDPVTFKKSELTEHRLTVPTEDFPNVLALFPQIEIEGYGAEPILLKEGFHHTQIRATWNWDYLTVRQPIRDIPTSLNATLAASDPQIEDGSFLLSASVETDGEEIALAEVMGDDDAVYAYDTADEYSRANENKDIIRIDLRSSSSTEATTKFQIRGSSVKWLTNLAILHQNTGQEEIKEGNLEYNGLVSANHKRWIYMILDKEARANAMLSITVDGEEYVIPIAEIYNQKMLVHTFPSGVLVSLSPYRKQIDIPAPLNQKKFSFKVRVWPEVVTEQYHLQLTTTKGKVFRSKVTFVPWADNSEMTSLRIFSNMRQQGMDLSVRENRIPDISYEFAPQRGNVLLTKAGRPFYAALGGLTGTITGRGTDQIKYWMSDDKRGPLAPRWVEEASEPTLEFNGEDEFLLMPFETIPHRSSFVISMDFKTRGNADQTLLAGNFSRNPSVSLAIRNGLLKAAFHAEDPTHRTIEIRHVFDVDLPVTSDTWNSLEVRYNFNQITFRLNGEERSFPCNGPGRNAGLSLIGPNAKAPGFNGWIRKLRIQHNSGSQ